jgi:hypothetical protein
MLNGLLTISIRVNPPVSGLVAVALTGVEYEEASKAFAWFLVVAWWRLGCRRHRGLIA